MLELLSAILQAADDVLQEHQGLSLFPGEYMDGSPAEPDISEVEIEIDRLFTVESGLPGVCVNVSTEQQGGWKAYLQSDCYSGKLEGLLLTTLEGYCKQNCDCSWCEMVRSQNVSAA